jgi:hypothetical protein
LSSSYEGGNPLWEAYLSEQQAKEMHQKEEATKRDEEQIAQETKIEFSKNSRSLRRNYSSVF